MVYKYFLFKHPLHALVLFVFTLVAAQLIAQDLPENDLNAEYGLVYFIRIRTGMGAAEAFSAIIDEKRVCKLNNNRYSSHRVVPGEHEFKAQYSGKKGKKKAEVSLIKIEAGKTYYISMVLDNDFWWWDVSAREITRNSALSLVKEYGIKPDSDCGETEYNF